MNCLKLLFGIATVVAICVSGAHNLDYSDLESFGFSCPDKDDCRQRRGDEVFGEKNCECDDQCSSYGDCCINAESAVSRRGVRSRYTCVPGRTVEVLGIQAISRCHSSWNGPPEVRRRCEGANDLSDPLVSAPATHAFLGLTYKNGYCAECNEEELSSLTFWNVYFSCSSLNQTQDFTKEDIAYNEATNKWGIQDGETFHPCNLTYQVPTELEQLGRQCHPAISSCARNWRRMPIKRKCESYTAIVYDGERAYRNPHCAYCNNVNLNRLSCNPPISEQSSIISRKKRPMSFALLLDVNRKDGDIVGTRSVDCGEDKKWDPFFKKCRNLVCAVPGYSRVNGRCVKDNA